MDIFINSTFAQSVLGFRLMRMSDSKLVDISSVDEMPSSVYEFFSEDLFKAIWLETDAGNAFFSPLPTGSYLGLKGFCGVFDNKRTGIVDIAFHVNEDEIFMLADIANKILCNYIGFSDLIFQSIHIDSAGDYYADKSEFLESIEWLKGGDFPEFVANTGFSYRTVRDMLHLAVCIGSQERALKQLSSGFPMLRHPKCMIDEKEFNAYITK